MVDRALLVALGELLKPVTWFPPIWAFACGVVASGASATAHWPTVFLGMLVAGPLVCGASQVVNDWYDREVDAINEPQRPIPSGRVPGRWGLYLAIGWSALAVLVASLLGRWGFAAACLGIVLAWMYSAPPVRLKRDGWWGNAAVGLSYEGLAWITGAGLLASAAAPSWRSLVLAALYSLGTHGIMTLNDFKSVRGDRLLGIRSLPARLGTDRAAWVACGVMVFPQLVVLVLTIAWSRPVHATVLALLLVVQLPMMRRFLRAPVERALWYSAAGVPLFVLGMMVSALATRSLGARP